MQHTNPNDEFFEKIGLKHSLSYRMRFIAEHFLGKTFLKRRIEKWAEANNEAIYQSVKHIPSAKIEMATYTELPTPKYIRENYFRRGVPVLIKGGAKQWQALKQWNFEFFSEHYGDQPVLLTNHKGIGESGLKDMELTDLKTIISGLDADSKKYARFNPLLDEHPELQKALDRSWLDKAMGQGWQNHHVLFLGNKGTKTGIHNAATENIFVQIAGRKRWLLWDQRATMVIDPEVNRGPAKTSPLDPHAPEQPIKKAFSHVPYYEVFLDPGDILLVPSYLWHYVDNLTPTIGVGSRWFSPYNSVKNSNLLSFLEFFNTQPNIFQTIGLFREGFDFNKMLAKHREWTGELAEVRQKAKTSSEPMASHSDQ